MTTQSYGKQRDANSFYRFRQRLKKFQDEEKHKQTEKMKKLAKHLTSADADREIDKLKARKKIDKIYEDLNELSSQQLPVPAKSNVLLNKRENTMENDTLFINLNNLRNLIPSIMTDLQNLKIETSLSTSDKVKSGVTIGIAVSLLAMMHDMLPEPEDNA
jgi:hypothetical protein